MERFTVLIISTIFLMLALVKVYASRKAKKNGSDEKDTSYVPLFILFVPTCLATISDLVRGQSASRLTFLVILLFGAIAVGMHNTRKAKAKKTE